jgi:MobA/MobL family
MLNIVKDTQARAIAALANPQYAPFKSTAVLHPDPGNPNREAGRRTYKSAVANYLYMMRQEGSDQFGSVPNGYMAKADDLIVTGRRHPLKIAPDLTTNRKLWDEADAAASHDPAQAAAMHVILTLPPVPREDWQPLVETFIDDNIVQLGMIADFAIHSKRDADGGWDVHPHCHLLITTRRWRADQRKGQRMRPWLHSKAQLDALESAWLARTGLTPVDFKLG